jgi:1-acyl-sn-glycerol-3-phosphate acyltransferase
MLDYDDIRAYKDHEVNSVLSSLLNDPDFLQFVAQQTYPKLNRVMSFWLQKNIRKKLKSQFDDIHNITHWQDTISPYVETMIEKTTDDFTVKGMEFLEKDKTYLFISNHRDIAMDPMLVNYALLSSGFNTCKVAIGDNLLQRPFVAKLMRLNKSFVVKRTISARREKLEAVQTLSSYIHESIKQKQSIWIAQKEGRAKDNVDKTDTAVLKMLHMAGRKLGWEFKDSMRFLNIVPVSISYEWDPCDIDKAQELVMKANHNNYEKSQDEDFQTIVKGMKGNKGRVSITFSKPLSLDTNQADEWGDEIDEHIYAGYDIFESNLLAKTILDGHDPKIHSKYQEWMTRFSQLDSEAYQQVLKNYAEPTRYFNHD